MSVREVGSYIGFNRVTSTSQDSASGIWSLAAVERRRRAAAWPMPFQPSNLSGLQLWLDASDASTLYDATTGGSLVAADGSVARWEDKSGNARHATEASNGPQRKTAVQGGLDVLRFDGSNDLLTFSNIAIPASHTVFAVFGRATSGIVSIPIANSSAINRYPFIWFDSDNTIYQLSATTFTQHGTANTSTGFFLATTIRTGTTSIEVRLDGVSVQTVTTGNGVINAASENWGAVGSREVNGVKSHHNGDIAEILIYDSALSDTDREAVENYLMAKWGIAPAPVPQTIPGLQLWLDASDASTLYDATSGGSLVAADGGVARWEDKSGNARHATQGTGANRPARKTAIQGGKDVLRFDGTSDQLVIPSSKTAFRFLHYGTSTVFIAVKPGTNSNPDALFCLMETGRGSQSFSVPGGYSLLYDDRSSFSINNAFSLVIASGDTGGSVNVRENDLITPNQFSVLSAVADTLNATAANRCFLRVNGGSAVNPNASTGTADNVDAVNDLSIGANNGTGTPSSHLDGDIAEILIYDSALSDTDRAAVENYLMAKWGIS